MRPVHIVAFLMTGYMICRTCHAQNVGVKFSGTIESLSPGYAIPGINVGDAVSGIFTYNAATEDSAPTTSIGHYSAAITELSYLSIGTNSYALFPEVPNSEISMINDQLIYGIYYDTLLFRMGVYEKYEPGTPRFFQLTFVSSSTNPPAILLSDALLTDFKLSDFSIKSGFITYMPPGASQGCNFILNVSELSLIPKLHIACLGTNIELSWSSNSTNFHLETTHELGLSNTWDIVTDPPTHSETNHTYVDSADLSAQFYRLIMQ